jgi:hypothetical protein
MTDTARRLIESFEVLPREERQVVFAEILRLALAEDYPSSTEDELVLAADQVFLDLDCREARE